VFDSGFGGLTVLRALQDVLPSEDFVYVGDTARYPYGPRDREEVVRFSLEIAESLASEFGVKMVVVACNTASAQALGELRERLHVPVVGVIEPGVRATVAVTRTGHVGVIGTVGTIGSGAYQRAFARFPNITVEAVACPGFVEFVERGRTDGAEVRILAERLLAPLKSSGIDSLLLGCTHYPFLARVISDVLGRGVILVSSADETAFEVARLLEEAGAKRERGQGTTLYFSSGDPDEFERISTRLLGSSIGPVKQWPY
jgi:glutamate racemase